MIDSPVLFLSDPLDPLHRFTPTPFHRELCAGSQVIRVETNDALLLPPGVPRETSPGVSSKRSVSWKLIRDPKAHGRLEAPTQLSAFGNVIAVFMGSACVLALDVEESELVAFIGSQVDEKQYHGIVLPILYQLSAARSHATADTECPAVY